MSARRSHETPRSLLRLLVLALVLAPIGSSLTPPDLRAQACGDEEEPNDVEAEIQPQAGLFCVSGTLPAEDQDLYLWEVDEETAMGLVSMRVTGIPATVTTAGVFEVSSEPGVEPVVAGNRLISVTAEPGTVGPATADFILGPGSYIVGISRTQTVDGSTPASEAYTLEMGAGAGWPERGDDEPNDDATTATEVASAFALSGDLKDSADVFSWTLSAEDAASAWELAAQVPINAQAELSLVDEAGATLARIPSSNGVNGRVVLYDLVLEPGSYTVQLNSSRDLPTPYLLTAVTVDRPPFDLEPNEVPARASAPDFSAEAVTGRLARSGDVDVYRLSLDDRLAASLFDVKLIRRSVQPLSLCLLAPDGTVLQCKDGEGGVSLADIAIPAGDYSLAVNGEDNLDVPYLLRVDATSAPVADYETEPNDGVLVASPFEPSITMRGSFSGVEDDYFRIPVTGDPQLWSVLVEGPGVSGLSLQDANGRELAASPVVVDSGLAELSDLYLPPGDHWIRVRGGDGDYTVRAIPLGPPDPNGEREANNDAVMGEPLLVGQIRTGRIVQATDLDYFRFSLAARDHVVVDLTGPADGSFLVRLSDGSDELARWDAAAPGEAFSFDGLLEPGDYVIVVGANTPSTERYELTVRRADPFDLADDQEPNGTTTTAGTLPIEGEIRGDVALQNDVDWYLLPEGATDDLELVVDGDNASARLTDGVTEYALEVDDSGERYTATETLPVDVPLYVIVSGSGTYRLSFGGGDDGGSIFDVPGADDRPVEFPVTAALSLAVTEVAAYLTVGQRLDGELSLTNTGSESRTVELAAATSHYAWMADPGEPAVEIGAGQTLTVPVSVTLLADAWADVPVRVTVAARDATGGLASAFVEITPTAEAPAVAPMQSWPLPDPLLGGLDVAATSLGAVPVAPLYPEDEAQLHDGITPDGLGYIVEPPFPLSTTVDLAGDAPLPIAGFVVNPQAGDTFSSPPRGVELLLSTDGSTFETVWSGELSAIPIEQAIVLDQPVEAAHARLIVTSAHSANALDPYAVAIGEWKVVAAPGAIPEPYLGADIASGSLGGHIVRLDPQGSDDPGFPLAMLDEDPARWSMRIEPGTRPSFVLGFHNDRAARISEVQWVDPAGSTPESRFNEVVVEVSAGSPLGPWEPLGSWELDREDDGTVAPFVLEEVRWARFLRFTGDAVTEEYTDIEYPATVRVIEQAATDEYRSILGEWGAGQPLGIYEALNPPDLTVVADEVDAPDSPADAAPLTAGEAITGRANIGADVDWYAVTIPDGENTLTFDLTGVPVVDVTVEVFDARQEPVPATLVEGATPGNVQYVAEVEAAETYTVRVAQPQHSIVFAFDTSGSIGPFYDAVFQALRSYTANVEEGQEYVNIVAFDEEPLLDGWTDDPYALSTAVSRYRLEAGSSSAETGVLDSTELLSTQEGTKAILLITDAETSSYQEADEMWRLLETVGPRIFAVQILAQSTHNQSQDWMQDWAISGDGHYQYTRTQAEMDRAFDRAATWLRRPAAYGISYATSQTSTEPGSLRVVSPPVDEAAGEEAVSTISDAVSVEIIYDTSGSMLAAMPDGQRRVDAARTVLVDLVTNKIPAGVPVALRVFGNTPGSCETSLAVPLAPLDPAAMGATIAAIEPVNEVKTPIGASLDQVANDLAGVEGPKIVILVTDGEETCDGDAAAAIERLAAEGVDVQVNIVGFALDDEELKSTFRRWARLGNGTYFDATNAEELDDAIAKAVQAPFRVYDAAGELVASGTVDGGSVRLPAGTYRVVVLTDPETVYEEVVVEPEGRVKLTLSEPPPE